MYKQIHNDRGYLDLPIIYTLAAIKDFKSTSKLIIWIYIYNKWNRNYEINNE